MSSSITDPTSDVNNTSATESTTAASPNNKGKGKAPTADEPMNEDEEDEDDEDDDDEGEDEDEDEDEDQEETFEEIDPSAIFTGSRRTRGRRVDYTSPEALAKAGLKPGDDGDDDEDDDVNMN